MGGREAPLIPPHAGLGQHGGPGESMTPSSGAKEEAPVLVLASGSPRRKALLEALGYRVRVVVPGVKEEDLPLPPKALAQALARRKGERVAGNWVLAADTVVDLDEKPLGKPKDRRRTGSC